MEDNLLNIVIAIVSVFLLFVFPVYIAYEKKDDISYALALKYTQDFVDEVRSRGYIDSDTYEDYLDNLSVTHNSYDVSLRHTYVRFDPSTPSNGYVRSEEVITEDTITNYLTNGYIYTMNVDDDFNVQIRNTNITPATVLYNLVTANINDENTRVYVNYGGKILSEKYNEELAYRIFDNGTISIVNGAPIPEGYKHVNGDITDGIVITEEATGIEWLWIPVEDFSSFSRQGTISNIIGTGYWETIVDSETNMPVEYNQLSSMAINCLKELLNTTNEDILKARYNVIRDMYTSVSRYGGFYVSKKTYDFNLATYGKATETSPVETLPITGTQWDTVLSYIADDISVFEDITDNNRKYATLEMYGDVDNAKRVVRELTSDYKDTDTVSNTTLQTMFIAVNDGSAIDDIIDVGDIQFIKARVEVNAFRTLANAQNNKNAIADNATIVVSDINANTTIYYRVDIDVEDEDERERVFNSLSIDIYDGEGKKATVAEGSVGDNKYYKIYAVTYGLNTGILVQSSTYAKTKVIFYNGVEKEAASSRFNLVMLSGIEAYASLNDAQNRTNIIEEGETIVVTGATKYIFFRFEFIGEISRIDGTAIRAGEELETLGEQVTSSSPYIYKVAFDTNAAYTNHNQIISNNYAKLGITVAGETIERTSVKFNFRYHELQVATHTLTAAKVDVHGTRGQVGAETDIRTTYNNNGYASVLHVRKSNGEYDENISGIFELSVRSEVNEKNNGVNIIYTIKNLTNQTKTARFAIHADIYVGRNSGNRVVAYDAAALSVTNNKIRMETSAATFYLSINNSPTSIWLGGYSSRYDNLWTNQRSSYSSGDSGLAFSWQDIEIPAYGSVERSFAISLD